MSSVILTCSTMREYVDAAQRSMGTNMDVVEVDRIYHVEPANMKKIVAAALAQLPPQVDTVLVGMGFCGGVWDQVVSTRRIVIPRADDCCTILLHTGDGYNPNLKEPGHLYIYDRNPEDYSARSLMSDYSQADETFGGLDRDTLFHMWFDNYHTMDIIDTGLLDVYSEEYATVAQNCADQIGAGLDYVPGSNRILEKLVSGRWDEQFLVAEPGHQIRHRDFFE